MLATLPIGRSKLARNAFFGAAGISCALVIWLQQLRHADLRGITPVFDTLFTRFDYLPALVMPVILVLAAFVPARAALARLLGAIGAAPWTVALCVIVACGAGAVFVYLRHPLSMDEYSPFLQSQAFAAGRLTGIYPPALIDWLIPFENQNTFLAVSRDSGAVASNYWPGFALLLTPFTWLGIPWMCNPVLSGLTIVALHRFVMRLTADVQCAGLALLLTVASPVFFADGISFYSMTAHMLCNVVFATLLLDPTPRRLLVAGVVGSLALTLHNPVPHLLFAAPWLLWLMTRKGGLRDVLFIGAGYLPLSLALGVGWFWYAHIWLLGGPIDQAMLAATAGQRGGFASLFGPPNEWTLLARLIGVAKIWLWSVPGLLLFACIGGWRERGDVRIRLLVYSAALTFLGYFVVLVDQGHGWGYRYFHSAWFVLPLLTALLARPLPADDAVRSAAVGDLRVLIVACALLYLPVGLAQRSDTMKTFVTRILSQEPRHAGAGPRVTFIDTRTMFYGGDLIQNDAFLRDDVLRLVSRNPQANAALMEGAFPNYRRVHAEASGEVWSPPPVPAP